jgi:serine/threonine protein kinase/formylglycine-generating enzyme required for sulfatase activity
VKPGHVVDRYEIVRPLGVGGMASVYLVRHTLLGSFHALKVLSDELVDDEHVRERFVAEGRIQAQLRHPNIVSVTEIVAVPGIAGLVLQYIDGPTLEDWLEKKGALRPDVIRAVFRPILAAMQTAHASGIVHRDLKPGNILLELQDPEPPIPFVTDFGIAKIAAETQLTHQRKKKTAAMMRLGTLSYMAPEQIERAADVDRRADIFALGAILYEMLAGQLAFDGPTEFAIMQRIVKGEPVPWPEGVALDKRLVACVDRALSPDPADRFPDCGIFLDFLGSSTTSTGIPAPFARRGGPIASESTQPPRPTPDVAKPSTATVADPVRPPAAPDARPTPLPEAAPTYLDPLATPAPAPAVASIPGPAADLPTSAAPPKKVPSKGIRRRWGLALAVVSGAPVALCLGVAAWQAPALSLWYATTIHTSEKALLASVWTAPNGTRLRYVPAGTVAMGSDPADPDREVDEVPYTARLTEPVLVAETEVTQGQWSRLMGTAPNRDRRRFWEGAAGGPCSERGLGEALPVSCVDWVDAVRYANALSAAEGLAPVYALDGGVVTADLGASGYRLPTEAEWTRAAAWEGRRFGVVDRPENLCKFGNVAGRATRLADRAPHPPVPCDDGYETLAPVAQRDANGLGLYDLVGNVWEWTHDGYDTAVKPGADVVDPQGNPASTSRVLKGGSWYDPAPVLRAANRYAHPPDGKSPSVGFRLVRRFRPADAWNGRPTIQ